MPIPESPLSVCIRPETPPCYIMRKDTSGRITREFPGPLPYRHALKLARRLREVESPSERYFLRAIDA